MLTLWALDLLTSAPADAALRQPGERERPRSDGEDPELRHGDAGEGEAAGRRLQGHAVLAETEGLRYGPGYRHAHTAVS